MNGEDKHQHHHLMIFQLLHLVKKEATSRMPPKGCMAVRVGGEGEQQQRFVVPVKYTCHPLFQGLLEKSEEKYGFDQEGTITIPCNVGQFRQIKGVMDRDPKIASCKFRHHHKILSNWFGL